MQEKKKPERGENKLNKGKAKVDEEGLQGYIPKIPFPDALKMKEQKKKSVQQEELVELFKQVNIDIPLLDAIKHVPAYAKFLKEMCTPKREPKAIT